MTIHSKSRVGIGLPVYNEQNHLAATLDSILRQTYQDFELIISDNASTDGTSMVCEAYAARDSRVRYYRQPYNVGASANFNRTFELLDADVDAVLCQILVKIIDERGRCLETYDHAAFGTGRTRASERFAARLRARRCMDTFGVIRAAALRKTALIGDHLGADRTLLLELALGRAILARAGISVREP
jgi:glycosyltransferase involved in cell wall biosynthesis